MGLQNNPIVLVLDVVDVDDIFCHKQYQPGQNVTLVEAFLQQHLFEVLVEVVACVVKLVAQVFPLVCNFVLLVHFVFLVGYFTQIQIQFLEEPIACIVS